MLVSAKFIILSGEKSLSTSSAPFQYLTSDLTLGTSNSEATATLVLPSTI